MRRCAATWEAEMSAEEHAMLLGLIRAEQFAGTCLEIGTAAGGTLCAMMKCFPDGARPRFMSVDRMTYFPNQRDIIDANLRRHGLDPQEVVFREMTSARAFRAACNANERFDFLLIDASHKIVSVTGDLRWTRLLNVGGIVCLHDYSPAFPGVWMAANRFLRRHPHYVVLGRAGSLLALRKQQAAPRPEISLRDRAHALLWHTPLAIRRKREKWSHASRRAA